MVLGSDYGSAMNKVMHLRYSHRAMASPIATSLTWRIASTRSARLTGKPVELRKQFEAGGQSD
jgi:hypothetical protein